jgi:hypothetical protein
MPQTTANAVLLVVEMAVEVAPSELDEPLLYGARH